MTPEKRAETEAREQLLEIARELEGLRYRLAGVQAGLASDDETSPAFAMRADIECVLWDRLAPAVEALRAAAEPEKAGEDAG